MFGNLGQLASLLRNAGQIKENMKQMQERLEAARHEGEAGGGQVRAVVDGKSELRQIKVDPALVASQDVELLEELIVAAVADACRRSRIAMQEEMQTVAGGMGLDAGMLDMLGK